LLKLRGTLTVGTDGREYITVLVERGETREMGRRRLMLRSGLSDREAQVLDYVAQGKTNAEIAIILGLSPLTVKKHIEHIYIALGVETRMAAASAFQVSESGQ
jgi:DNA-binding CsgD family transcriptional regulator